MPRKAHIADYYSSNELKNKYLKSTDPVESRRWHLLWKLSLGWTIKNSALAIRINYDYAKEIVKKYNNLGEEGVKNCRKNQKKHRRGKKPLLTEEQLEKLMERLESSPSDGGIWTGPKVARWIEEETRSPKVWNQRGWDYLKKCEYSLTLLIRKRYYWRIRKQLFKSLFFPHRIKFRSLIILMANC